MNDDLLVCSVFGGGYAACFVERNEWANWVAVMLLKNRVRWDFSFNEFSNGGVVWP